MKKTLLKIGLLSLCVSSLLSNEVNLNDPETVGELGYRAFSKDIDKLNTMKDNVGLWYLYHTNRKEWKRVHQDEFELEDAKEKAFNKFIAKNKDNKYINDTGSILLGSKFGKYDFKKQQFPIQGMDKRSYLTFEGSKYINHTWTKEKGVESIQLLFNNINDSYNFLPMSKSEAKEFIKSRKNSGGNVTRDLTIKYYYTLKEINNKDILSSFKYCKIQNEHGCYVLSSNNTKVSVVGQVNKMEIMDNKGNILHTYDKF